MDRVAAAAQIMEAFGHRTGVTPAAAPRRYLWTDAFAVCNYLALHTHTGAQRWAENARALIHQVHQVLGRHRLDDRRRGWISGLGEAEGSDHPTIGGLRIGKPLPERPASDPADERLDWDRDGQYYHYLTRWMHALERAATALREPDLRRLGVELALTAHAAFAHGSPGRKRLYWKMSVDLSQPVVTSMGQHDPLDGLVETAALAAHGAEEPATGAAAEPQLQAVLRELADMCAGRGWATTDALGLGMLMTDALFLADPSMGPLVPEPLLDRVVGDAARSLGLVTVGRHLSGPAHGRLAFRELGLSIGLAAVQHLDERRRAGTLPAGHDVGAALDTLLAHCALRDRIESFWLDPRSQATDGWAEHEDINAVMLATSLLPDGYLG